MIRVGFPLEFDLSLRHIYIVKASIYNTHDQARAFKRTFNTFALNVHCFPKNKICILQCTIQGECISIF